MGVSVQFGRWVSMVGLCAAGAFGAQMPRPVAGAWDAAVAVRAAFEGEPAGTHTKFEYTHVMDGFRAIYHGDPADVHASRAVEQVAELLAEQGREFDDAKSLENAAGQYAFLLKNYPSSAAARESRDVTLATLEQGQEITEKGQEPSLGTGGEGGVSGERVAGSGGDVAAQTAADEHYHPPARHEATTVSDDAELAAETRPGPDVAPIAPKKGPMAIVTGIRHWSTPTYTRVAIDLGDEVQYQAARVENPDRIYFDLHHARLAHELVGKSFAVNDDGFLTRIRAAQYSDDVTRVVLDVHEVSNYSAFLLPNPYRLIIDIHGKTDESAAVAGAKQVDTSVEPRAVSVEPRAKIAEVSSLPPMAVTDGAAGFGLPDVRRGGPKSATVAAPRVVIPQKSTASRPVPNATGTRSADQGVELAAVSEQPGRVVATSRPTSRPVAEKTGNREKGPGSRKSKATAPVHVEGEPVEAAVPTADGETSLLRALGLKIGRIVIDAGHGGHDSGTLGVDGIEEKDVVLDVALRLGKLLHDRLGAEIVYTRADDTFIPLETRTAIANKAQADLFISVHANSSSDPSARGVEVYYLNFTSDPDAMRVAARENAVSTQSVHDLSDLVKKIALKDKIDESKELATDVDQSLYAGLEKGNAGLKNRGVKKAPFVVLIGANMPSILAEISFVTNPKDAAQLATPAYRERVAESLFKGVEAYAQGINGPRKSDGEMERAAR